jgi:hypothetical protein
LETGASASKSYAISGAAILSRSGFKKVDWGPYALYAIRIAGSYSSAESVDRLDEIVLEVEINSSEQ